MTEYKVVTKEVTSAFWRDLPKAAAALAEEVSTEMASGWKPVGGVASVQAGSSIYLLQALVKSD